MSRLLDIRFVKSFTFLTFFVKMVSRERIEVNKASKMPKAMEMDAILCAIKAMKKYDSISNNKLFYVGRGRDIEH